MTGHDQTLPTGRFIEEMGLIFQSGGAPRIAGRVFGLLIIEGRELTLHEISDLLMISRASASTNARLLAKRGILRLTARAGDRQDYYALAAHPYFHFLDDVAEQMERNAATINACAGEIDALSADVGSRVRALANFYQLSANFLGKWADFLRDSDQTTAKTPD